MPCIVIDSHEQKDYLSWGEGAFAFPPGRLVQVHGRNLDVGLGVSNGSGKSGILDGICYNLTGKPLRKLPVGGLIRIGAEAMDHTTVFSVDDRSYMVERSRSASGKQKSFRFSQDVDGVWTPIRAENDDALQALIYKEMGVPAPIFRLAVFLNRDKTFASLPDAELKDLMELLAPELKANTPSVRWLSLDPAKLSFKVTGLPAREDVDADINEQLIIEFYSR